MRKAVDLVRELGHEAPADAGDHDQQDRKRNRGRGCALEPSAALDDVDERTDDDREHPQNRARTEIHHAFGRPRSSMAGESDASRSRRSLDIRWQEALDSGHSSARKHLDTANI
jgi:hypothetical protein